MKSIYTLKPDIYELITRKDGWFNSELSEDLGQQVARRLRVHFNNIDKPTLRLSKMGPICPHALWHSIHNPHLAEKLPAPAMIKYSFGHIIEAQTIALIKAAGHSVEGEQDELVWDGIKGHRDCIVDGVLCDVKSSSSRGMEKYEKGLLWQDDPFGYLDQLDGYLLASQDDPLLKVKDRAFIIAIDKQMGHIATYEHKHRPERIRERIADYKGIVGLSRPPVCRCGTEPDGQGGNIKLDLRASYSSYKHVCFPNLRTFIYSKGPVYLTKVVKVPSYKGVPLLEVDSHGNQMH